MLWYIFCNTKINIFICVKTECTEEEKIITLEQFHDSILGHLGINKTIKNIKNHWLVQKII